MPCNDSRAQKEDERFLFFLGKDSANEKPWNLFTVALSTSFSPLRKCSPSLAMWGLAHGFPWLQTPICNSVLIPNKPVFDGEISGSLFVSGQHTQNNRGHS